MDKTTGSHLKKCGSFCPVFFPCVVLTSEKSLQNKRSGFKGLSGSSPNDDTLESWNDGLRLAARSEVKARLLHTGLRLRLIFLQALAKVTRVPAAAFWAKPASGCTAWNESFIYKHTDAWKGDEAIGFAGKRRRFLQLSFRIGSEIKNSERKLPYFANCFHHWWTFC